MIVLQIFAVFMDFLFASVFRYLSTLFLSGRVFYVADFWCDSRSVDLSLMFSFVDGALLHWIILIDALILGSFVCSLLTSPSLSCLMLILIWISPSPTPECWLPIFFDLQWDDGLCRFSPLTFCASLIDSSCEYFWLALPCSPCFPLLILWNWTCFDPPFFFFVFDFFSFCPLWKLKAAWNFYFLNFFILKKVFDDDLFLSNFFCKLFIVNNPYMYVFSFFMYVTCCEGNCRDPESVCLLFGFFFPPIVKSFKCPMMWYFFSFFWWPLVSAFDCTWDELLPPIDATVWNLLICGYMLFCMPELIV